MPVETLMTKVISIDSWLEEKFSIKVPVPWLRSCLQNLGERDSERTKAIVFHTWLCSDLRDIGCDKLPAGIADAPSITIEGSYNLQIEEVMDVSQSPYDQLKKLLGKENENTLVNCDASPDISESSSRVLKMTVTDGFQTIFATEYSTIPDLSANMKPGTKIRVMGPIKCYAATLMLTKNNIVVYGGEVTRLLIKNCQKNVLSRALNLKELVIESGTPEENSNVNNNEENDTELNDLMDEFDMDIDTNLIDSVEQMASQNSNNEAYMEQMGFNDASNRFVNSQPESLTTNTHNTSTSEKRSRLSIKRKSLSQRTVTEFLSQSNKSGATNFDRTSDVSDASVPYTYLSKALEKELSEPSIVFVKAFIGSFVSKLKRDQVTREWNLQVIINDGTMAIGAMVSHAVLHNLVSPGGKEGMKNVQKVLVHCNTVMKVKLNPPPNIHEVLSINENIGNLDGLTNRFGSDVVLKEIGIF